MQVDLRSDTITQPCNQMRMHMAEAPVGDDVYGEDPTVWALEEQTAILLGKEQALFVPSGTMANQIALLLHCRPGDEVLVAPMTHCMTFESGAAAALAGVQPKLVDGAGVFTPDALAAAVGPGLYHMPRPSLVVLENTHNAAGGVVWTAADTRAVTERARALGLAVHLDGARLWNAAVATGTDLSELAAPADTVAVCFSKGLGAPVGSAIVGDRSAIKRARRLRKMLGGGMRQVGVLAAAALHALDQHLPELGRDHELARRLHHALAQAGLSHMPEPMTNILRVPLPTHLDAVQIVEQSRARGVLFHATGPHEIRLVVHRDVKEDGIDLAAEVLVSLLASHAN